MYCSSEKTNVPNIYRLTMSSLKTHVPVPSHTVSLISLVEKMRQQHSSSSQRQAGTRLAGGVFWAVGVA